ncbi:hypothetical protein ABEW26_05585 [Bacillus subtilis]|nr:hypothetical protein [Bacillus subtilis]MED1780063.1 hypothetical protein [Bacillus subtilis]NJF07381.1 hypothetical protein [Bacillus subtilis]NRF44192.1 hypothetical protein [Bacillus subtilis]QNK37347.1 hypothetical protein H8S71_02945 [Bacillus subtilis subsp. subtilis]RRN56659.1 hypothetical protein EI176_17935 [Bacillus subtilis subsp. subtilis]
MKSIDLTILSLKRKGIRTEKVLKNQNPDRLSHMTKNAQPKSKEKED